MTRIEELKAGFSDDSVTRVQLLELVYLLESALAESLAALEYVLNGTDAIYSVRADRGFAVLEKHKESLPVLNPDAACCECGKAMGKPNASCKYPGNHIAPVILAKHKDSTHE